VLQSPPNFLRASDLSTHVKPIAIVPEPDTSDADSEADVTEAPVEPLIDTSSLSSSSQVNCFHAFHFFNLLCLVGMLFMTI